MSATEDKVIEWLAKDVISFFENDMRSNPEHRLRDLIYIIKKRLKPKIMEYTPHGVIMNDNKKLSLSEQIMLEIKRNSDNVFDQPESSYISIHSDKINGILLELGVDELNKKVEQLENEKHDWINNLTKIISNQSIEIKEILEKLDNLTTYRKFL